MGKYRAPATRDKQPRDRLPFLFALLIAALLGIGVRLVFIQAVEAQRFNRLGVDQRTKRLELAPNRGTIYDRNGAVLAISVDMETVFATPYQVKNKARTAAKLAPILEQDAKAIETKLRSRSGFVYLGRKVEPAKADAIRSLKLPGIGFAPESKRLYPGGPLASQTLGFVGLDNVGLSGLELRYDKQLRGRPGELYMEQGLYGQPIPGAPFKLRDPSDGKHLMLTVDKEIQYKAEVELKATVDKFEAAGGLVAVMSPKTGEILALANEPTFDLNNFATSTPDRWRNRAVTDVFEPGSTMKIVTASAGLDLGLFNPSSVLHVPPTVAVGGYTIRDAHDRPAEDFTYEAIVTRSSNVGAVHIGQAVGKERLFRYVRAFGLNQPTGVDLPGESQGYIPAPDQWSSSSLATISFGQGISATALEMLRTVAVIANRGRSVKPHIVSKVIDSRGEVQEINHKVPAKQAISAKTAMLMSAILEKAVDQGTGANAKVSGYRVAGKTGTAQKPKVNERGYDPGKYVSSFIGFAPARDPALVILVAVDEPRNAIYGGDVAAPVFAKVAGFALQRLRVKPN